MDQGFVLNEQKVLKVIGNHQIGAISYNEEQSIIIVEGIVDLDHGSRFEGLVLTENKFGIPFGYGEMYDDDDLDMERVIIIMDVLSMKDIGVMIIDLELEKCMIAKKD